MRHKVFGEGSVVSSKLTRDDEEVTVAFPKQGIKKLMASLAGLEVPAELHGPTVQVEGGSMTDVEQLLVCRDLRKRFGERTAVDGVSFHIGRGETYGLLGPNGAGKTTSISMICGLLERDGGEVTVAGQAMDISAVEAKSAIGYVPQDLAIYPDLSARENLRFFGKLQRLSGKRLDERVDVRTRADRPRRARG